MIYLDHAATTPICEAAKRAIIEHLDDYGNPSSSHEFGRKSRVLIEDARERIAKCINAKPDEIYFTSSGSEANTMALYDKFSCSSCFEHHSVKASVNLFSVNSNGFVSPKNIAAVLDEDENYYSRASCMFVNNELGTIQPIKTIASITHKFGTLLHVDAVQAVGHIPVDVKDINCDLLSSSGHKFGAPKGAGFLYAKYRGCFNPVINGGKQENGLRPGTENILGIISMAAALEDSVEHMEERNEHIKHLRDMLLDKLLQIPGSHLNGSLENRVVSNINIRFDGVSGSRLVALCSLYDICISSGSACNEGTPEPSHVLKAIGLSDKDALSSIRITLGHENTIEEIEQAATIITKLVERIREDE